jgi:chorismate mutase
MSVMANHRFIAFNINAKPRKMGLITDDLFLETNHLNPDENIVIVSRNENLEKLILKKTSFYEIDYKLLVQLDPNTFENCNLFISNFPFSNEIWLDPLKRKGNQIQVIAEIETPENFIKKLQFCHKNGIRLIIDVCDFSNVNWHNYEMKSEGLGILFNNKFNQISGNSVLQDLRAKIEACDKLIYEQFAIRMTIIEEIAQLKKSDKTEAYQPSKFIENILSLINRKNITEENKMDVLKLYQTLHDLAVERQKRII